MSVLKLLLRLAIGAALLVALFWKHGLDWRQVLTSLAHIPWYCVLAAAVLDLAGRSLSAYRWARISALAGHPVSFKTTWQLFLSGTFFNICLPTSIGGDVVRVVGLSRHTKSKSAALASVFMDRNVGMAALLTIGLCSAVAGEWLVPATVQATLKFVRAEPLVLRLWPLFLALSVGFVFANLVLFGQGWFDLADRWFLRRLPQGVRGKIGRLHAALQAYRLPLGRYGWIYAIALVYQASEVLLVYVLARGLGLDLPFAVFGAMVTFQAVAGLLPITVNNIGVREGIFCAVLMGQAVLLGQAPDFVKDEAFALAWIYFGVIIFSGLVGGVVYMLAGMPKPTAEELRETDGEPLRSSLAGVPETVGAGK